jgi:addiction module RelE/StbE family toxin
MKILFSIKAQRDINEIKEYISRNNPENAKKFISRIIEIIDSIPENPLKGRVVPEYLNSNIREIIFKNYRIVYKNIDKIIFIVTISESHKLLKI